MDDCEKNPRRKKCIIAEDNISAFKETQTILNLLNTTKDFKLSSELYFCGVFDNKKGEHVYKVLMAMWKEKSRKFMPIILPSEDNIET